MSVVLSQYMSTIGKIYPAMTFAVSVKCEEETSHSQSNSKRSTEEFLDKSNLLKIDHIS